MPIISFGHIKRNIKNIKTLLAAKKEIEELRKIHKSKIEELRKLQNSEEDKPQNLTSCKNSSP